MLSCTSTFCLPLVGANTKIKVSQWLSSFLHLWPKLQHSLESSWCNNFVSCSTASYLSSLNHYHTGDGDQTTIPLLTEQTAVCVPCIIKLGSAFHICDADCTVPQPFLALNCLLKFKGSPPWLPNAPNAALNEAISFIGTVGGLWVTRCPFKKIMCFPFNGLRMTNCFQGKFKFRKLQYVTRKDISTQLKMFDIHNSIMHSSRCNY